MRGFHALTSWFAHWKLPITSLRALLNEIKWRPPNNESLPLLLMCCLSFKSVYIRSNSPLESVCKSLVRSRERERSFWQRAHDLPFQEDNQESSGRVRTVEIVFVAHTLMFGRLFHPHVCRAPFASQKWHNP